MTYTSYTLYILCHDRISITIPDLSSLVHLAISSYGRIDHVINNTGHPPKGDLITLTDQQWSTGFEMILMNV